MWPWEHFAVGYIAVSLLCHLLWRRSPDAATLAAVALGSQFPDLVDKPLAWEFGVLSSGISLAHSVFTVVVLSVVVVLLARRRGYTMVGFGFAVAYALHPPMDAVHPIVYGEPVNFEVLLWPLVTHVNDSGTGFLENLTYFLSRTVELASSPEGQAYVAFEVALLGFAFVLWLYDGAPGLPRPHRRTYTLDD
ncbi:metal-dependent hydrolase [Halomarina halobia]|uniref:Metal-dependent hydrolase n=1 Tax=Halomarina halobia TaxID=3033386 RepID=A0ABD6AF31_9EURY|nr:metal-dependent hydrolase [Halomarina sp. PSR21]